MKLKNYITTGIQKTIKRFPIVVLLFIVSLLSALMLSLPMGNALAKITSTSGYVEDLMRHTDILVWVDIFEQWGRDFGQSVGWVIWLLPLFFLWKIASSMGILFATQGEANHSFWYGVKAYFGKGVLLALFFGILAFVFIILLAIIAIIFNQLITDEVGSFWINFVLLPFFLLAGFSFIALMHDYGKIALVQKNKQVLPAFLFGVKLPFRQLLPHLLFFFWFVVHAIVWVIPTLLDGFMATDTALKVFGLFLLQQVFLLLRSGVSMAWLISEATLTDAQGT